MSFVYIKLDKDREFRLSNKAFVIFEQTTGQKMSQLDFNSLGITDMNHIVYAGLKSKDNDITFDQVVDLLDEFGNVDEISKKITEAIDNSSFFSKKNSNKQEEKS